MTRITMRHLQDLARRGRVPQAEVDRIIESQERGRKALTAADDAAIAALPRLILLEPIEFTVPIELWTENRLRAMQPLARGGHIKVQRAVVRNAWLLHFHKVIPMLPVTVTFTRHGRHMDAHDSLAAAFKHVTDEVTTMLGLRNDDTKEVEWKYQQTAPKGMPPKITIRITPLIRS